MKINEMTQKAYQNSKDHGWHEQTRTPLEVHMLIVSEVSEATEAVREAKPPIYFKHKLDDQDYPVEGFEQAIRFGHPISEFKPEGEAIELADVVLRVMDYFGAKGWDLEKALQYKHQYNETRPYKHGNKLL